MYFIYGNEDYFINSSIKKITKEYSNYEIINIQQESNFEYIMDNLKNNNIFSIPKIFIFKNSNLLNLDDKNKISIFTDELLKQKENVIIFSLLTDENNKLMKKPLINFLLKHAKIEEVKKIKENELSKYIKQIIEKKGGTISFANSMKLASKLPNDLNLIINEIEKLLSFNKNIDENSIKKFASSFTHNDPFAFSNAFQSNKAEEIFSVYNERIALGDDINYLIGQIASILALSLDIHHFQLNNYTNEKIAEELGIHPFRIKKANEFLIKIGTKKIKILLEKLALLDMQIKNYEIDEKIGFENFLLQSIR